MKAIVYQFLVRKTKSGRLVVPKKFEAKKEVIKDVVNDYINERVNKENFIPVYLFAVKVFDYKGRMKESWEYRPTYR